MAVNEMVHGNLAADANKRPTGSRSESTALEAAARGNESSDWKPAAEEVYNPLADTEERCVHCGRVRPPQKCPVCHCMYSSVAAHIGIHSTKKTHTSLLDLPPANEDGVPTLTADLKPPGSKSSEEGQLDGVRPSEQSHMCAACGEILPNVRAFRQHSKRCLKFVACTVCGANCENRAKLRSHMKVHAVGGSSAGNGEVPDDFSCAACGDNFGDADRLAAHMEEQHVGGVDRRVCGICGKTFMHADSLRSHLRSHTGRMPFRCQTCGKACRTRKDLREHSEVHSAEKRHGCPVCGKRFRLRKTYLRHRVIHGARKNVECAQCGMRFWFGYQRARHMLVHSGLRPYVCGRCGDRFSQWNGLSQHRLRSCRRQE